MNKEEKVRPLARKSLLVFVKNAEGSKLFSNFYANVDGEEQDIIEDGKLACAFFVSFVLNNFGLISDTHMTVDSLEKDLNNSDWEEISEPKPGAVLVWEKKDSNRHIGFYLGEDRAISNSSEKGVIDNHHYSYNGKRKIEKIYYHKKLDE